jgi:hypothetical protein
MYSECEQTLGEASATNNVCAGGYKQVVALHIFSSLYLYKYIQNITE